MREGLNKLLFLLGAQLVAGHLFAGRLVFTVAKRKRQETQSQSVNTVKAPTKRLKRHIETPSSSDVEKSELRMDSSLLDMIKLSPSEEAALKSKQEAKRKPARSRLNLSTIYTETHNEEGNEVALKVERTRPQQEVRERIRYRLLEQRRDSLRTVRETFESIRLG